MDRERWVERMREREMGRGREREAWPCARWCSQNKPRPFPICLCSGTGWLPVYTQGCIQTPARTLARSHTYTAVPAVFGPCGC